MPGDTWQKFANLRAYFGFMWTHPGKKLLFMGGEFGQPVEWDHDSELAWDLLEKEYHRGIRRLIGNLNSLYRSRQALHELDCHVDGFEWIAADDNKQSVIAFLRRSAAEEQILVVCNFTPVPRDSYRIGVPVEGNYQLLINTDSRDYDGSNYPVHHAILSEHHEAHGRLCSIRLSLPPLCTLVYEVPAT